MKARNLLLVVVVLLTCSICSSCSFQIVKVTPAKDLLSIESKRFHEDVSNACTEYRVVPLADLVPVAWDRALLFQGYISAKKMYDQVGYEWRSVRDNSSDEQFCTFVFLKDGIVVYEIEGWPSLYVTEIEVFYQDIPSFIVTRKAGEGDKGFMTQM